MVFHYMPTGNDAVVELMPNPQQREKMYHKIREYRSTKAIFGMDFQNDAQYVGGCIAGGRRYLHINANGDVDPCVFIHYSNANIYENTLLEALKSPIFMAYHDGQPFNENMLRPCPMLENPQKLRKMVEESGAKSTDLQSPESVEHLCAKCDAYAEHWAPKAEELFPVKISNLIIRKILTQNLAKVIRESSLSGHPLSGWGTFSSLKGDARSRISLRVQFRGISNSKAGKIC